MFRRLIVAITAAALALGPMGATSAVALEKKERTALALLLGAATLGIIINQNNRKKKQERAEAAARNDFNLHRHGYDDDHDDRWRRKGRGDDRGYRDYRRRAVIPAQCVFPIRGYGGRREVVSERCVIELGAARRLPGDCAFRIRDEWGGRTVYGTRCLRERGWRIAGVR